MAESLGPRLHRECCDSDVKPGVGSELCRPMLAARCKWSPGNAAGYRGVTAGETALHKSTDLSK